MSYALSYTFGYLIVLGKQYPKVECISIEDLLNEKRPKVLISLTFEIPNASASDKQGSLFID